MRGNTLRMAKKLPKSLVGRPRLYAGDMKMRSLRFPLDEWEQWQAAAEADGVSMTQFVVNSLRRTMAARKRKKG
jgi:hypothetical protein